MPELSQLNQPNNGVNSAILAIYLHGLGGDGDSYMTTIEGNTPLFDGISVVCPTSPFVNGAGVAHWPDNGDTTRYIRGLIEELNEVYDVGTAEMHIGGHSDGCIASYEVANVFNGMFNSVSVSSGYLNAVTASITCRVTHIHGTLDTLVTVSGVEANTFPKLVSGGADLNVVKVFGAGHGIDNIAVDEFATINSKLSPNSVGKIFRSNIS